MGLRDWLAAAGCRAGDHILEAAGRPPVRILLPGGISAGPRDAEARFTLSIRRWSALAAMLLEPEIGFGDGYARGDIEVEGPLEEFCAEIHRRRDALPAGGWVSRAVSRYLDWTQRRSLRAARKHIHHHYDRGNGFYQLWLDREMVYTCAFFPREDSTLEEAQIAKMERVARKLALEPGERVAEAGCGWGSFALYIARVHGCRVRAFNISEEQIAWARHRARELGLEGQVEFVLDDYRNITGVYDAFVSIGMLEHVGKDHYADLRDVIRRCIGDSGRGLLHFIGRTRPAPLSPWIRRRIFPGAYAPALSEALPLLETGNYRVMDIENLRPHYARTLRCWRQRYEAAMPEVVSRFGAEFARAWRLYLAGSEAAFRTGSLELYQILFAGVRCTKKLWTRESAWQEESRAAA
ncbi:MAG: cyclopropane-fatty-acyl-phospholipid synthase family protein [Bryobacteraceae bacterium]|nr:cyclopropane-fatty-acyl-phospholipid synthase family protein [Bryobacteraceae bacterium]